MKNYFLLIFLNTICFWGCNQTETGTISSSQKNLIHNKSKVFPNQTQISIGIIKNNKVFFYGILCKNNMIIEIKNYNKAFEIGSLSKVFTATLLVHSIQENHVKLEEHIDKYLNFKLNKKTKISFKELANHTSGLPRLPTNLHLNTVDQLNPYQGYTEEKLKQYLTKEMALSSKTGKEYTYSNLGYGLLGYVLTKVENKTYEELLQNQIFLKYNMQNSTTYRKKVENILVRGRNENGTEVPNWDLSVLVGAGGILSTVEDLTRFITAQFNPNNTELALTRKKTSYINPISDIGLGWHIVHRKSGATWHQHNGGTGGYTSTILMDTAQKNGVIILSNISAYSSNSRIISDLSFALIKTLN